MPATTNQYWIKSAGRAGSNIVWEYLQHATRALPLHTRSHTLQEIRILANNQALIEGNTVVHDHTDAVPYPEHKWHLVRVQRRNTWAQALSWAIAKRTQEYWHYNDSAPEPFHLEWSTVENLHNYILQTNSLHSAQAELKWASVHLLYYEDIVQDYTAIDTVLAGPKQQPAENMIESRKSPRTPGSTLVNWQEIESHIRKQLNTACQD